MNDHPSKEDEDDPERVNVIAKYSGKPHQSTDDWENPSFSIYATTDYYGFIHDRSIPGKYLEALAKVRKNDLQRESKWRKMVSSGPKGWQKFYHNNRPSELLTRRVYKGIPQAFRMTVWPIFLDVQNVKAKSSGIYQRALVEAMATSQHLRQIDLDVNRTFRDTTYFRERYGERQQALFRVLGAYSHYNAEVGYCQGMSELAGLMLIYLTEEEDAFWALSQLMKAPKFRMEGLFIRNFPKLLRLFQHHEQILSSLLPKLGRHLTRQDIPTSLYALKWFMQCFLGRVPLSLCLRLWDIYLLDGERVLVAMAYNIMKMHKKRLMKMDQNQLCAFLQNELAQDFLYEDDMVVTSLKECMEELKKAKLDLPPFVDDTVQSSVPISAPVNRTSTAAKSSKSNQNDNASSSRLDSVTSSSVTTKPRSRTPPQHHGKDSSPRRTITPSQLTTMTSPTTFVDAHQSSVEESKTTETNKIITVAPAPTGHLVNNINSVSQSTEVVSLVTDSSAMSMPKFYYKPSTRWDTVEHSTSTTSATTVVAEASDNTTSVQPVSGEYSGNTISGRPISTNERLDTAPSAQSASDEDSNTNTSLGPVPSERLENTTALRPVTGDRSDNTKNRSSYPPAPSGRTSNQDPSNRRQKSLSPNSRPSIGTTSSSQVEPRIGSAPPQYVSYNISKVTTSPAKIPPFAAISYGPTGLHGNYPEMTVLPAIRRSHTGETNHSRTGGDLNRTSTGEFTRSYNSNNNHVSNNNNGDISSAQRPSHLPSSTAPYHNAFTSPTSPSKASPNHVQPISPTGVAAYAARSSMRGRSTSTANTGYWHSVTKAPSPHAVLNLGLETSL